MSHVTGRPESEFEFVIAVPDSMLSPVVTKIVGSSLLTYVQAVHESQAVALGAGLALAGRSVVVCMENSGIRAACETIARLLVLHRIPVLFLISQRGGFGDSNWWSQHHSRHALGILDMFAIPYVNVEEYKDLVESLRAGLRVVRTRMTSAAVLLSSRAVMGGGTDAVS